MKTKSILQEAAEITSGDRNKDYGHPFDDFMRTARLWSPILGIEVTPIQVALCMMAVKMSRAVNSYKRDNFVDLAGYAHCAVECHEEQERRVEEMTAFFEKETEKLKQRSRKQGKK